MTSRFWSKVRKDDPQKCWPWSGATDPQGVGKIKKNGVWHSAPRVSWWLSRRQRPPSNMAVVAKCGNRACVNPVHLVLRRRPGRLTKMQEWAIIRIHARGDCTAKELAGWFDVSPTTIGKILHERAGQHPEVIPLPSPVVERNDQIRSAYRQGASLSQLARDFGISTRTAALCVLDARRRADVRDALEAGVPPKTLAAKYRVPLRTIKAIGNYLQQDPYK